MEVRSCFMCGRELTRLCYRVGDRGDVFYYCECGATVQLKRPPGLPKPRFINEWSRNEGRISIKDQPLRRFNGGYHINRKEHEPREEMSLVN